MIFQCDLAFFVELPDIDSGPCFESFLPFVRHRSSFERLVARRGTNLRFSTNRKQVSHGRRCICCQQLVVIHRQKSGLAGEARISKSRSRVRAGQRRISDYVQGYVRTQPPEPLLKALLQRDCTANVPVEREMFAEAPWPEEIQAHLSAFSAPGESSQ